MRGSGPTVLVLALVACAALLVAQSRSPAHRFQQAIDLMETKGDYAGAIRVFEELARASDRQLAARSLLYVGLCYEKLGRGPTSACCASSPTNAMWPLRRAPGFRR